MKNSHIISLTTLCLSSVLLLAVAANNSVAFERYSSCSSCHGGFEDGVSKKVPPTVFPNDDKHRMHRSSNNMDTDCNLCHRSDDGDNPFIGSSDGISGEVPGLGCTGCHIGSGLRAHHVANSVGCYAVECHDAENTSAESVSPPYYGTAYTKANNPCNDAMVADTNENWSVGDFLGLDNDGDTLADQADFDCGPAYRMVSVVREGSNIRVSWETVGGRTDVLQASGDISGAYSDVSGSLVIPGVGPVTTNYVEVGGATGTNRFYRVKDAH